MTRTLTLSCLLVLALTAGGCIDHEGDSNGKPIRSEEVAGRRLREAALAGKRGDVEFALKQGAPVDAAGEDGRTALMLAAFNGHTEVVKLLLEGGADVSARDAMDRTALMYASTGPYEVTVELLIDKGAVVNVHDGGEHWTPLMFAAAEGHIGVVRTLLEHGADTSRTDTDGDTAADFAQRNGHAEVFRVLRSGVSR